MQPHQQRVVEEKTELDDKLMKLNNFLSGEFYKTLGGDERVRLARQAIVMQDYSGILADRIKAFE